MNITWSAAAEAQTPAGRCFYTILQAPSGFCSKRDPGDIVCTSNEQCPGEHSFCCIPDAQGNCPGSYPPC